MACRSGVILDEARSRGFETRRDSQLQRDNARRNLGSSILCASDGECLGYVLLTKSSRAFLDPFSFSSFFEEMLWIQTDGEKRKEEERH